MLEIFAYYIGFGGARFFALFFIFLMVYFTGKLWYHFYRVILFNELFPVSLKQFIKKVVVTLGMIVLFMLCLGIGLERVILHAQIDKVVYFSEKFLQMDNMVFGAYLPFWFQDSGNVLKPLFDTLSLPIIVVYRSLSTLLGVLFSLLFVFKPQYFYKAVLSFAIMFFIGLPLWFFFPAVSPFDAYVDNVLQVPAPEYLQPALSAYHPNRHLASYLTSVGELNDKNDGQFFAVTAMPSMHIAWSLLILFFGIKLWRPLALFLIPYFLLNAIATVYSLQHYTVDIPAGLLVGVVSIWIAVMIARRRTPQVFTV